jgi:hypothetical protein
MKNNWSVFNQLFFAFVLFISVGCSKSDILETDLSMTRTKVLDDTLASIQNSSIKIASSSDRIYMTYGIGKSYLYEVIGPNFFYTSGSNAKLNGLDNDGNLLWTKSLPIDIVIEDLITLPNGDCVAAGSTQNANGSPYIYLFRFDRNGKEIYADSVALILPIDNKFSFDYINLIQSVNGNILVYGFCYDNFVQKGFACEYDNNLNPIWERLYPGPTFRQENCCTITTDGGYLFAGLEDGDANGWYKLVLMKTNASGDIEWTKFLKNTGNYILNGLITMSNGNYCMSYTNMESLSYTPEKTYLIEINTVGDSINSAMIDVAAQKYNPAIIGLDNGNIFALMNSLVAPVATTTSFDQKNSGAVVLTETLTSNSSKFLQTKTSDLFNDACQTSNGRIACAGIIQPFGRIYYKPCILFYN